MDAAPRVRAHLDLDFVPTGVLASPGHALVYGDGPTLAWVDLARPDEPKLVRTGVIEGGAQLARAWSEGSDAWLVVKVERAEDSVAGTLRWLDPQTGQPSPLLGATPGEPLTALLRVDLAHTDEPLRALGATGLADAVIPAEGRAWMGFSGQLRVATLADEPTWEAEGELERPTGTAMVARALADGSLLRVFWDEGERVELTTIGVDGRGGVWTRERAPIAEGKLADAAISGDRIDALTVDAGGAWARTTITPGHRETRKGVPVDERSLVVDARPHVEGGELVMGEQRVFLQALRRSIAGSVGCVASPRPPPMPPPVLGNAVALVGDVAVARRPGSDELWRVEAKTAKALAIHASGLWKVGDRVLALTDGGQNLVTLDRDLSHVEHTVPLVGNVVDVEVTGDAAFVLLRTGDSACGTSLVRVPADPDAPSRVYGLVGAPVDVALQGETAVVAMTDAAGGVVATVDPDGTARGRFGATATPVGLRVDADGVRLAWTRAGAGTAVSRLDPESWADAPAVPLDPAPVTRAWLAGDELVWARGDAVCSSIRGELSCVAGAAPDEVLELAGRAWLRFGDDLQRFVDGRLGPVASEEIAAASCSTRGERNACKKRKGDIDTPASFAIDGVRLAVVDQSGLAVRDLRTGAFRMRFRFPGEGSDTAH